MLLNILAKQNRSTNQQFFVVSVTFPCCYKLPKNLDFNFQIDYFAFENNIILFNNHKNGKTFIRHLPGQWPDFKIIS